MFMDQTDFGQRVLAARGEPLVSGDVATLQVNVGYRCNLACRHCHVQGSPQNTVSMDQRTVDQVLTVLAASSIPTLDITGGAPELNPAFLRLATEARRLGRRVIVRTNLAVFSEAGMHDLPDRYRTIGAEIIASLPCYLENNVDGIRGSGTFRRSIDALRRLNALGYGGPGLPLNLVYNPGGPFLPPDQDRLEQDYKRELKARYGVFFSRLYAFTNMPIGRFRDDLARSGRLDGYCTLLRSSFNPATLDNLMCRTMVSVGPDGRLFDCDFNQALDIGPAAGAPRHIDEFDLGRIAGRVIETGDHCYACSAGQGST